MIPGKDEVMNGKERKMFISTRVWTKKKKKTGRRGTQNEEGRNKEQTDIKNALETNSEQRKKKKNKEKEYVCGET